MADMSKAEKLAAARKRLKEYQQKGKDVQPAGNKPPVRKITPKRQNESGVGSPSPPELNPTFDSGSPTITFNENISNGNATTPVFYEPSVNLQECLPAALVPGNIDSYFSASHEQVSNRETNELNVEQNGIVQEVQSNVLGSYSDVFSVNAQHFNPPASTFPSFTMPSGGFATNSHFSDVASARNFFDYFSAESQNQSSSDMNIVPKIKEPEPVASVPTELNIATNVIPIISANAQNENLDIVNESPSTNFPTVDLNYHENVEIQNLETTSSPELERINDMEEVPITNKTEEIQDQPMTENFEDVPTASVRSTSESLRQLSLQMNGLIEESSQNSSVHGEDSELERRNQELAAMLATEKQKTEKLELQLKEYQSGMCQLQLDLDQVRTESEARVTRELGPVQEQLQLHIQTVGILVGEKTELQAALTKSQNLAKQKAGELEELQSRLKASRHKVAELEKEASTQQESCEKLVKTNRELSSEFEKLKQEQLATKKNLSEKEEEVSELHQKLNTKMNDCAMLQSELQEKQSQLSLTQLRVQQLSTTDTSEVDGQLEILHQQKVSLEKQVAELQQTIKSVGAERDQASQQYQQYCKHLNSQVQSLYSQVESLTKENEELTSREQNLLRHVSQMEKQLQMQQQQQQKRKDSPARSNSEDIATIEQLKQMLEKLESENQTLNEKLETQVQISEDIKSELSEKVDRIEELEATTERLKLDQPDNDKLLAAMESDKLAASRAVGQNRKLKEQLEELQDGFVKMSNDKLVLTENLQAEQHVCKEQGERLAQQEDELKELREQLSEKEQQIKKNTSELTNQMMQQNQIADRMRHYEAQGQFHELLQQELEQAKERIQALSTQNNELRTLLAQQTTHDSGSSSGAGSLDDALSRKDEMMATLSASVRQLELERDQLLERLRQTEQEKEESSLHQESPASEKKAEINGETTEKDYNAMKVAMEQLEERFTKTMKEVADLSDEKQRLEHLVLQLQGETETIGEYIALYQVQRSILRQRAQEKDEQLIKLSRDREEMRNKLGELNNLVHQLVAEKEAIRKMSHGVPLVHNTEETPIKHEPMSQEDIPNGEILEIKVENELNEESNLLTPPAEGSKADTADKIMALLSEIGTSSLVDPQCSENFHPCPWCSGRLITV